VTPILSFFEYQCHTLVDQVDTFLQQLDCAVANALEIIALSQRKEHFPRQIGIKTSHLHKNT
jgi:hypothetical protein